METTFKIAKDEFLRELQIVGSVINPKVITPALTNVFCEIKGNTLYLIGNNSEQQVETSVNIIDSSKDVSFLVEKGLIDTLKTLSEQPLSILIDLKNTSLVLTHYSGDFKFSALPSVEYPKLKVTEDDTQKISLTVGKFKAGLHATYKQMADDALHPVMNCVLVEITPEEITYVASDGHRLSKYTDSSIIGNLKNSFLIPRNSIPVLLKQLANVDKDETLEISINSRNVSFVIGEVKITSRLTEGRYPNYNAVIPANNDKFLTVDSNALSTILNRLLIASNANTKLIRIDTSENQTIFSSEDNDLLKSAKEITNYTCNKSIQIGAKGTFLLELISNTTGEIQFSFSDQSRAMLISPIAQAENTNYTLLLMPMMLND